MKLRKMLLAAAIVLPSALIAAEPVKWTAGYKTDKVKIDGKLDEECWQNALWGSSFTSHGCFVQGAKETDAAFLWDEHQRIYNEKYSQPSRKILKT